MLHFFVGERVQANGKVHQTRTGNSHQVWSARHRAAIRAEKARDLGIGTGPASDPPSIVLDPFCGTATSGEVALKLGRHFIGVELYENYAQIAEERCRQAHLLRSKFEAKDPMKKSRESFGEPLSDTELNEVRCDFEMVNRAAC
jgi:hypothetical protein